ncbi:glucoamylase family protein [Rhizobium laguerreae]|uniref:glucoamylase family protein n=1 Tax=Rhizobium laguerreae TaxID=1076926 RepID=UPI001C902F39|nr:glucoamylase family protein [Rhizobium laguerreae]MBY3381819.1 hypothetical protein [Rhizobium laguerreae]
MLHINSLGSQAAPPLDSLLEAVQRRTFEYFWSGCHSVTGLPFDRCVFDGPSANGIVSIGGVGFGALAIVIGVERRWITRSEGLARLSAILGHLGGTERFRGAFPHFIDGDTGRAIPFSKFDDGADLVETTLLLQGLICAREYFDGNGFEEITLRRRLTLIYDAVEWNWFTRGDHRALFWHWSPNHGWAMNVPITGWNEALSSYILAAGSETFPITTDVYDFGWSGGGRISNGREYHGIRLPLGEPFGGPLFLSQYTFCVLDPRGLSDRHCEYLDQIQAHTRINYAHCMEVPAYREGDFWGLTAGDGPEGYCINSPLADHGIITLTAAISSFPFAPVEAERALRAFLSYEGGRLLGRFGFADGFQPQTGWVANTQLAINQGPILAMIENFRSSLLWRLFSSAPEVVRGLNRLKFNQSNHRNEYAKETATYAM